MKLLPVSLLLVVLARVAAGQSPLEKPTFEVAAIKPSEATPASSIWIGMEFSAGTVRYSSISLRDCIRAAYRVRDFQIQGPAWIRDFRYEITAKLGAGTPEQIPEMLQSLLEERFKLTLDRSTKDQMVYALVLGKSGPTLEAAEARVADQLATALGPDGKPRPAMSYQVLPSGVELRTPAATLATVAEFLSRVMDRPVLDMTGLTGQYDLTLTFMPDIMGECLVALRQIGTGAQPFPSRGRLYSTRCSGMV